MFIELLIILVLYMVFDMLWFGISVPLIYLPKFTEIQGTRPDFLSKIHGGIFAWVLLALGLYIFVLPKATSSYAAAFYGLLYGFIVYGIYNGTNYVTLNKYDYKIFFPDLIWGSLASMGIALLMYKFNKSV